MAEKSRISKEPRASSCSSKESEEFGNKKKEKEEKEKLGSDIVRVSLRVSEEELSVIQLASRIMLGEQKISPFINCCLDEYTFAPRDLRNDYASHNNFQQTQKAPSQHLRNSFTNDVRFAIGQMNRLIGLLKLYYYSVPLSAHDLDKIKILYGAFEQSIGELVDRSARKRVRVGQTAKLKIWAERKKPRGRPPEGRWKTISFSITRARREQLKKMTGGLSLNKWIVQTVLSRELPLLVNLQALNDLNEFGRELKDYHKHARTNLQKERALKIIERSGGTREVRYNPVLVDNFEKQIQCLEKLVYPERHLLSLSDMIEKSVRYQATDFSDLYEDLVPQSKYKEALK